MDYLSQERLYFTWRKLITYMRATKAFLEGVGAGCSRATAVKFLAARKFDVGRASALWRQHEATRRRERLDHMRPFDEPLATELATAKFTILASRDPTGAAIALFTANKHFPAQTTHQITLQGVVYQLDVALQSLDTQRAGLVFIYDMTDSKYTNFDYELSQKILTMLKGGYPAKLKKVLIVTAPLWFKAPFRILRLFVREKLRERVHTVSAPQLASHIPRAALPKQLGGHLVVDHAAWLEHCRNCYTNNLQADKDGLHDYVISNHLPPPKSTPNGLISHGDVGMNAETGDTRVGSNTTDMHISDNESACPPGHAALRQSVGVVGDKIRHTNSGDEDDMDLSTSGRTTSMWCSDAEQSSGFSDEEWCGGGGGGGAGGGGGGEALTARGLAARVRALGRRGLVAEYEEIRAMPPAGTFHHSKLASNLSKNRYTDVLCYDHSRVQLAQTDPRDPTTDYINANYVDGYKQKNAYICTQGPLPKTFGDFWRMVWEQQACVVVMTTRAVERGRVKCGQYWPEAAGGEARHGDYVVRTERAHHAAAGDHVVSDLTLTHAPTGETRQVWHGQYVVWADYSVPGGGGGGAEGVLAFLQTVRRAQAAGVAARADTWAGHALGPPIVVHCSAGIGRTGTFLTLDICTQRLDAEGVVDVRGTVERIRAQRAHSIQMPEQYVFCHVALIEYAMSRGYLEPADWPGLEDATEESD